MLTIAGGNVEYNTLIGRKYRVFVLLAIGFLCLVREAFYAATSKNTAKVRIPDPSNLPRTLTDQMNFAAKRLPPLLPTLCPDRAPRRPALCRIGSCPLPS